MNNTGFTVSTVSLHIESNQGCQTSGRGWPWPRPTVFWGHPVFLWACFCSILTRAWLSCVL